MLNLPTLYLALLFYIDLFILLFVLFIASRALFFFKRGDFTSTETQNFTLLASTSVKYLIFFKSILLFWFLFTIDDLSNLIKGAMCALGVFYGSDYLTTLFFMKIALLFIALLWIPIASINEKERELGFTKALFLLLFLIATLLLFEMLIEFLFLSNLNVERITSCCSIVFGDSGYSNITITGNFKNIAIGLYIGTTSILIIGALFRQRRVTTLISIFHLIASLIFITVILSPYIYELPTHICPFCILQKEYGYIGYFIYTNLLLACWFAFAPSFIELATKKPCTRYLNLSVLFTAIQLLSYLTLIYTSKLFTPS